MGALDTCLLLLAWLCLPICASVDLTHSMYTTGVHENSKYFESPQYLYNGSAICTNNTYAVIIVLNIPSDLESSSAIRNTWGSVSRTQKWLNKKLNQEVKMGFI